MAHRRTHTYTHTHEKLGRRQKRHRTHTHMHTHAHTHIHSRTPFERAGTTCTRTAAKAFERQLFFTCIYTYIYIYMMHDLCIRRPKRGLDSYMLFLRFVRFICDPCQCTIRAFHDDSCIPKNRTLNTRVVRFQYESYGLDVIRTLPRTSTQMMPIGKESQTQA